MRLLDTQDPGRNVSGAPAELVRRYRKIGISAVAAALACETKSKKPAAAPVERRIKERELQVSA